MNLADLWTPGKRVRTATREGIVASFNQTTNMVTVVFTTQIQPEQVAEKTILATSLRNAGLISDHHFTTLRPGIENG